MRCGRSSQPIRVRLKSAAVVIASLAVPAGFVFAARSRTDEPLWTAPNTLTMFRLAAATGLAAAAVNRRRSIDSWIALLVGCTLTDWLDGPLARLTKPTRLGALLDIEADSWLTLWAAAAAWRARALPVWCLVAPTLRYPIRLVFARNRRMSSAAWQQAAGTLQMTVLCGALSPWQQIHIKSARLAPFAMVLQLGALFADALSAV